MYAYDFEYDGHLLSEYGFIVCEFNGSDGVEIDKSGSEISFITAPYNNGKRFANTGSQYESCLKASIQICKDPELFDKDEMEVSDEEFRAISRWLNRRAFLWLRFHDIDSWRSDMTKPWFRASFVSLKRIEIAKRTYGVELDIETDAPFGYGDEEAVQVHFESGSLTADIEDLNDEIGTSFPVMDITCEAAGTLTLSNDMTGCLFQVKNVTSGEIIHLSGDTMIITSSNASHDIANDFNYDFFSIGNTYDSTTNTVTASIPCTVTMRYRPIWKDTI